MIMSTPKILTFDHFRVNGLKTFHDWYIANKQKVISVYLVFTNVNDITNHGNFFARVNIIKKYLSTASQNATDFRPIFTMK